MSNDPKPQDSKLRGQTLTVLTVDEFDEPDFAEHLPPWAVMRAYGVPMLGAQLPTKDGRRCGNAHIIEFKQALPTDDYRCFVVLTDAGNRMTLTPSELQELFYPPEWVSDVAEVLRKFDRQ